MGGRLPPKLTVTDCWCLFLEDVEATQGRGPFLDYRRWCTEFAKDHGSKPVRAVTKAEANEFKLRLHEEDLRRRQAAARPYKPKTVNHALIALRRAFNWAVDTDRLPPEETRSPRSNCCTARAGSGSPPRRSTRDCSSTVRMTPSVTCSSPYNLLLTATGHLF